VEWADRNRGDDEQSSRREEDWARDVAEWKDCSSKSCGAQSESPSVAEPTG
jgi:hypothetical protein